MPLMPGRWKWCNNSSFGSVLIGAPRQPELLMADCVAQMGTLTFKEVDHAKYPAVELAYSAGRAGGTMTGVLSAANEKVHTTLPRCLPSHPICSAAVPLHDKPSEGSSRGSLGTYIRCLLAALHVQWGYISWKDDGSAYGAAVMLLVAAGSGAVPG